MATVTLPYTFVAGATALASEVNGNFNAIVTEVNGNLSAANLADAAVTENKLDNLSVATGKIQAGAVTDAKVATGIAATKIGGGLVSNTEFGYLNGVTSAIQTQLNARFVDGTLTANRVAVSDVSGNLVSSTITDTKLDYLANVNSDIQTQLNAIAGKVTKTGDIMSGNLRLNDGVILELGSAGDAMLYATAAGHAYLDLNAGIGNFYIRDGTTTRFTFDDAGDFTATGDITAFSDERVKTDIETIVDAGGLIDRLRGVTFLRTDRGLQPGTGVIAQEVEQVIPEVVHTGEDGMKSVSYGNLVGVLIEAVKDLRREVQELRDGAAG